MIREGVPDDMKILLNVKINIAYQLVNKMNRKKKLINSTKAIKALKIRKINPRPLKLPEKKMKITIYSQKKEENCHQTSDQWDGTFIFPRDNDLN